MTARERKEEMTKVPITACIIAYNEEENIRECLKSIAWVDEIVVVDAFSEDRTAEVCREFTDKVYRKKWSGFKEQKNYALSLATNDWVLSIDADERVSPELAREIKGVLSQCSETISGFYFPRRAYYLGGWINHGGWYPNRKPRLFRKERTCWVGTDLHERAEIQGPTQLLKNDLWHFPHKDLADHLKTVSNYSDIASKEMHSLGKKFRLWQIILHPPAKFLETYLWKWGFMDGARGLIIALMSSYYVFLKYAKLWEKERMADAHTGH